jgi:hypothetical protein
MARVLTASISKCGAARVILDIWFSRACELRREVESPSFGQESDLGESWAF